MKLYKYLKTSMLLAFKHLLNLSYLAVCYLACDLYHLWTKMASLAEETGIAVYFI